MHLATRRILLTHTTREMPLAKLLGRITIVIRHERQHLHEQRPRFQGLGLRVVYLPAQVQALRTTSK